MHHFSSPSKVFTASILPYPWPYSQLNPYILSLTTSLLHLCMHAWVQHPLLEWEAEGYSDEGTSGSRCDIPKRYVMHAAWSPPTGLTRLTFVVRYATNGACSLLRLCNDGTWVHCWAVIHPYEKFLGDSPNPWSWICSIPRKKNINSELWALRPFDLDVGRQCLIWSRVWLKCTLTLLLGIAIMLSVTF